MVDTEKKYYRISEVAKIVSITTSQLRFWGKQIACLKPKKSSQGVQIYTKEDLETIQLVKFLILDKKYTTSGANQVLKKQHKQIQYAVDSLQILKELKQGLEDILDSLP